MFKGRSGIKSPLASFSLHISHAWNKFRTSIVTLILTSPIWVVVARMLYSERWLSDGVKGGSDRKLCEQKNQTC